MNTLKGKKVLLIAPVFFGYETNIRDELLSRGATVYFMKENDDDGISFARLMKCNKNLYIKYVISKLSVYKESNIDFIFCIRVNNFDTMVFEEIKRMMPCAKIILYYWDSIKNLRNAITNASYADEVYSFDRADCERMGWTFRPLFFTDLYKKIRLHSAKENNHRIMMIATLTPKRYEVVKNLSRLLEENHIEYFIYLFMNRWIYMKRVLINKEYDSFKSPFIHHKEISSEVLDECLERSDIVLDICHSTQSGLTMRAIESFGAGKKLITNNRDIVNYDLFDSNRVHIYEGDQDALMKFILDTKTKPDINDKLYYKYSIAGWIDELFHLEGENDE